MPSSTTRPGTRAIDTPDCVGANQDARALAGAADGEVEPVDLGARLEHDEIELDDVPADDDVGVEAADEREQPEKQGALVGDIAAHDQHVLDVGRGEGSGEERSVEAVGLEVERERRQGHADIGGADRRIVEDEHVAAQARAPAQLERAGDEALHEEALVRLHV